MSLPSEISLEIDARSDIRSFKVAVLFFTRALSEHKDYRTIESVLGDDESVPTRALLKN